MIRKITPSDRELYLKLSGMLYSSEAVSGPIPESRRIAAFEEMMRSDAYLIGVVAECGGVAAGYGLASKMYSQEAGGIVLWLEELFILPEYRSRGLGMEFFEYMANISGVARMRLEFAPENLRAESLYRRLGFVGVPYKQLMKDLR